MKNLKLTLRIGINIGLLMIVAFFIIWYNINTYSTGMVTELISNQMKDAVESRAGLINDYVQSAEEYMEAFGQADEVKNLLLHKDDPAIKSRAQEYTENFAEIKGIFEGLYIADYESETLTHNIKTAVGMKTREGDSLKELQNNTLAKRELSNNGVMMSPSTGNMVISMYYPIYDNDKCIGYVGAAVYAKNLMDSIIGLEAEGLPQYEYAFINNAKKTYIYNEDESLLNTETDDEGYIEMLKNIEENPDQTIGMVEHTYPDGDEDIIVYRNIPERGWTFAVRDCKENIYASLTKLTNVTSASFVITLIVLIAFLVLIMLGISKQLRCVERAIGKLGRMELDKDLSIQKYVGRKDEVGVICTTLDTTADNLRSYITEMDTQLAAMSEGDFARESRMKYIGAFETISSSMNSIQKALRKSFREISTVTEQLSVGSQNVAQGAANLAEAASNEKNLTLDIDTSINDVTEKVRFTADQANTAKEDVQGATDVIVEGKEKMEELMEAMKRITETTDKIGDINSNIEKIAKQTHLLALNASVEATRAGEAGRGFSVVANEIRELAEQSNKAADNANNLIEHTIEAVKTGTVLADETANYLYKVVEQTKAINQAVTEIAEASEAEKNKLDNVAYRLNEIEEVVEITASTAEESAAASLQLDTQIKVLQKNLKKYRV